MRRRRARHAPAQGSGSSRARTVAAQPKRPANSHAWTARHSTVSLTMDATEPSSPLSGPRRTGRSRAGPASR
eukprot:9491873-Pyramimonas_sp.AAC.1